MEKQGENEDKEQEEVEDQNRYEDGYIFQESGNFENKEQEESEGDENN